MEVSSTFTSLFSTIQRSTDTQAGQARNMDGSEGQENSKRRQGKRRATSRKVQQTKKPAASDNQQGGSNGGGSGSGNTQLHQILRIIDMNVASQEAAGPHTPVGEVSRPATYKKESGKENNGVVSSYPCLGGRL